ncbi:DUF2929 family protein [Salinibacillus xinjiangensis]|uniref:DUF2929 family protein n=1 Tax=Salinibacillus xinjiangensis TaxID=1229268 RepID=A0A6G1X7X2_9BACI|nr:DUF2929 family protein [Salinibacillus xinjiangensis]MRG87064.1 DUF2929 family protein [Salinibacillus xinjiangensis]
MRFIFTFIWGFLLSCMITYVIGNMAGIEFSVSTAIFLGFVFSICVSVLGDGVLKEENA